MNISSANNIIIVAISPANERHPNTVEYTHDITTTYDMYVEGYVFKPNIEYKEVCST